MFPRRRGRGVGPLACLMTKHFDLKFAASMKLVKARAWRLPVVPPGTSPIDRQPAAINPRHGYHGLSRAGPKVRIHLPPADSPSLTANSAPRSRTPAFRAGVRAMGGGAVGRDRMGLRHGAYRRQCLCWAKFQYRSASDVVQGGRSPCRAKLVLTQPVKRSRAPSVARAK